MTVRLHRPGDIPASGWLRWIAIGCTPALDPAFKVADIDRLLDYAWNQAATDWYKLARALADRDGASLAHAPACAGNASDLGLMLAWSRLVADWAAGPEPILVLCDDPWLFRHLATLEGVKAGTPPPLAAVTLKLALRGLAARLKVSLAMFRAARTCRAAARALPGNRPALLVYGHPASKPNGEDAYFGRLMAEVPELVRLLHVDCPPNRARMLSGPATASLHGFGSPRTALMLWRHRWRPHAEGPFAWLVRRAAAREGATGTPAMIAWQLHCQERWLAAKHPVRVLWPWENHSWERAFVRACRARGIATIGYQHATIGRLELNYRPGPEQTLPDRIVCAGVFGRNLLAESGVPADRLTVAGAWRFAAPQSRHPDPNGPVFVALPADRLIAQQMLRAIIPLAQRGWRFLVREHPMTPVGFVPSKDIAAAPGPLSHVGSLRVVLYAGTTVGIEAVLAGLPVVRFRPDGILANDILPPGLTLPSAGAADLEETLAAARPLALVPPLFAAVDIEFWRNLARGK